MLEIAVTTAYDNEQEIIMIKQVDSQINKDIEIIDLTPDNIANYGVCGYKDVKKHLELRRKIEWFKEFYPKGLRIKALFSKSGGYQGMLEYIPVIGLGLQKLA